MCKSNDKIPLCWKCRWIICFFFLAVLGMWGIIYFLEKPAQQEALSHWISVLIFLVTIVCTAIPLYMNNRYLELEKNLKKKIKKQQNELKISIEEQRKGLESKIEEQRKRLKSEIEKANQETYEMASNIYLDLCRISCKMARSNKDLFLYMLDCSITTVKCMIKSNNSVSIKAIMDMIDLIYDLIRDKDINVVIDEMSIKSFNNLLENDTIRNNKKLFDKCIQIFQIMNAKKEKSRSGDKQEKQDTPE